MTEINLSVTDTANLDPEIVKHLNLWAEVAKAAISDARVGIIFPQTLNNQYTRAVRWVRYDGDDPGSFRWILTLLNIDVERARKEILNGR